MGSQAIDLSAGLVPKQQPSIDLSAGLIPKQQTLDPSQPGMQPKDSAFFSDLRNMIKSAPEAAVNTLPGFQQYQQIKDAMADYDSIKQTGKTRAQLADAQRKQAGYGAGYRALAPVAEGLGVNVSGMEQAAKEGDAPAVLGHAAAAAAPVVAGAIGGEMLKTPQGQAVVNRVGNVASNVADKVSPRGVLADRMAEIPPGERFSRQEVLNAAREKGVNLDLADATDSGVARGAKNSASVSIAGKGTMEANASKNLNALEGWANATTDKLSPSSAPREVVGSQMQAALKSHLDARTNAATQIFNDLDRNVGGVKPDAANVYDKAQQIVAENKDYFDKNPALKQSRAWQIVNDLAEREKAIKPTTSTVQSPVLDESGRPISKEVKNRPKSTPDSWQDLQKLRSDIMSEYRSPEIVGTRAEGWLKQLAGEVDKSMTGAGSGLSGPDLAKFRQANGIWESIKNTYDNPQSPYYQAVRTQYPSGLPANLASRPELAASVRRTLSSLQDGSTVEGAFQRQFVENLINDKSGKLDLKNLNSKLSRTPDDVLKAMVGDEGARNLRMLGKVSQKVTGDVNPSATGKVLAPFSEGALLFTHPLAGATELGANFAGSKVLTNPRAIDFLTKKKQ